MAELIGFDFNPDAVTDRPGKTLLPVGDYIAEVTDSDFKDTKNGLGKYINLEFTIVDGEYVGRKFYENLNVMNKNEKTVEIANRALKDLIRAVNMLGKPFKNSEMLHNIPLKVRVTMGKRTDNGEDENRLRFLSINEVSAPVATAPAAAWSQASASPSAAATGNAPKKKPWEK